MSSHAEMIVIGLQTRGIKLAEGNTGVPKRYNAAPPGATEDLGAGWYVSQVDDQGSHAWAFLGKTAVEAMTCAAGDTAVGGIVGQRLDGKAAPSGLMTTARVAGLVVAPAVVSIGTEVLRQTGHEGKALVTEGVLGIVATTAAIKSNNSDVKNIAAAVGGAAIGGAARTHVAPAVMDLFGLERVNNEQEEEEDAYEDVEDGYFYEEDELNALDEALEEDEIEEEQEDEVEQTAHNDSSLKLLQALQDMTEGDRAAVIDLIAQQPVNQLQPAQQVQPAQQAQPAQRQIVVGAG